MVNRLRSLGAVLVRRGRFEDAMRDELQFHIEAYADDLVAAGVPRAEAERRARVEFGGSERVKEECRQARGLRLLDEVRQDVRYAVRSMAKTPSVHRRGGDVDRAGHRREHRHLQPDGRGAASGHANQGSAATLFSRARPGRKNQHERELSDVRALSRNGRLQWRHGLQHERAGISSGHARRARKRSMDSSSAAIITACSACPSCWGAVSRPNRTGPVHRT